MLDIAMPILNGIEATRQIARRAPDIREREVLQLVAEGRSTKEIANSILVFSGRFDLSLVAAVNHARRAQQLLTGKHLDDAVALAKEAVHLAPKSAETQATMCLVLTEIGRTADARPYCEKALRIGRNRNARQSTAGISGR